MAGEEGGSEKGEKSLKRVYIKIMREKIEKAGKKGSQRKIALRARNAKERGGQISHKAERI